MYCKYCGFPNNDGAEICQNCHRNLAPPPNPTVYAPPSSGYNLNRPNSVSSIFKSIGSSKMFLTAVICMTISIFSIVLMASTFNFKPEFINDILYELSSELGYTYSFPSEIYDLMSAARPFYIISAIIEAIPSIILVSGIWMLFAEARKKDKTQLSTSGLTLIKGVVIYYLVIICIAVLASIALIVLSAIFLNQGDIHLYDDYYFSMAALGGILLFTAVLLVLIFAAAIVYYAFIIKAVNSVKKSVSTNIPSDKYLTFIGVICFIMGFGNALSALSTLSLLIIPIFSVTGMIFMIIAVGCSAAAMILFGILTFKYKSKIRELIYARPSYNAQPPVPPVPPYQV